MIDDSHFIIRWEVDNATAILATGRAESGEFDEGGFRWIAAAEKSARAPNYGANFTLQCVVEHNGPWYCEAEVSVQVLKPNGFFSPCTKSPFCFNRKSSIWLHESTFSWMALSDDRNGYHRNGKLIVEFHIRIISAKRGQPIADPAKFASPTNRSDVILTIEGKKVHVSKEFLAIHSPVFEALFFGNYSEKGKDKVQLKDVVYEEFIDLLHVIYPGSTVITDRTVLHILKLADQFQMERAMDLSKRHLAQSKGFDAMKKLQLAGQYRLDSLMDTCLGSFTNAATLLEKLKASSEYANFSPETKIAICDRMVQLKLQ